MNMDFFMLWSVHVFYFSTSFMVIDSSNLFSYQVLDSDIPESAFNVIGGSWAMRSGATTAAASLIQCSKVGEKMKISLKQVEEYGLYKQFLYITRWSLYRSRLRKKEKKRNIDFSSFCRHAALWTTKDVIPLC